MDEREALSEKEETVTEAVKETELLDQEEVEEIKEHYNEAEGEEEVQLGVPCSIEGKTGKPFIFSPEEDGVYCIVDDTYGDSLYPECYEQNSGVSKLLSFTAFHAESGKKYEIRWNSYSLYPRPAYGTWKIVKLRCQEMTVGETYKFSSDDPVYYRFTPEKTGAYRLTGSGEGYGSVAFHKEGAPINRFEFISGRSRVLEGGVPYELFITFVSSKTDLSCKLNRLESVEVEEGTTYEETADLAHRYTFRAASEGLYKLDLTYYDNDFTPSFEFRDAGGSITSSTCEMYSGNVRQDYMYLEENIEYVIDFVNSQENEKDKLAFALKIRRVSDKELKLDQLITFSTEDAARYTYSPTETGPYQLVFDKHVQFRMIEDSYNYPVFWSFSDRDSLKYTYHLKAGEKYNIYISKPDYEENEIQDCKLKIEKLPLKNIEADTIYQKDENESVYYHFKAKSAGRYIMSGDIKTMEMNDFDYFRNELIDWDNDTYVVSLYEGEEIILIVGKGKTDTYISSLKDMEGMSYVVQSDGTVEIIGYQGDKKELIIPDMIDGKKVTSIREKAFWRVGLTSVKLPSTLKSIGRYAFSDNPLAEIVIPDSVTDVGGNAFSNCGSLKRVTLGAGMKVIPYGIFMSCTSLEEIIFSENGTVREIQSAAFSDCSSLSEIAFPNTIEKCGSEIFGANESVYSPWYKKQPNGEVYIGRVLYKYKGIVSAGTKVTVKPGIVSIGSSAFRGQWGVSEVILPDSLKEIGDWAFSGTRLKEIVIPDSVTEVGKGVFSDCVSLKKVTFGSGIEVITNKMFEACKSLEEIVFPKNGTVREVQYDAFRDCTTLSEIEFPDTIEKCDSEVFGYNEESDSTWYKNQPDGVIYIGSAVYKYKGTAPDGTKITLKPGTASIAYQAFFGQKGVSEVILPYGLKEIGQYAFVGANSMQSIVIPSTVTAIGEHAIGYILDTETNINSRRGPGYEKKKGFIICGEKGSEAEKYATEYGFKFIEKATYAKGDVDLSGKVDISDLRLMLRSVCGKVTLTDAQITAGDIAGKTNDELDGQITIADLRKLLRFICGKIEVL